MSGNQISFFDGAMPLIGYSIIVKKLTFIYLKSNVRDIRCSPI